MLGEYPERRAGVADVREPQQVTDEADRRADGPHPCTDGGLGYLVDDQHEREDGREDRIGASRHLAVFFLFLARDAQVDGRHRFQPVGPDHLAAAYARTELAGFDPGERAVYLREQVAGVVLQGHVQFLAERRRALVGHVVAIVVLTTGVGEIRRAVPLEVRYLVRKPGALLFEPRLELARFLGVHNYGLHVSWALGFIRCRAPPAIRQGSPHLGLYHRAPRSPPQRRRICRTARGVPRHFRRRSAGSSSVGTWSLAPAGRRPSARR